MPADLRQGRLLAGVGALRRGFIAPWVAAHTDDQYAAGPQVQGRADGRGLPHCAIAEVLFVKFDRSEQQRNRGACQQVLYRQLARYPNAPMTQPGIDGAAALIEGHRLPGLITKGRHRHRLQVLAADSLVDAVQVQTRLQQVTQGGAIEQRHRHLGAQAQQAVDQEATGLAYHPRPIAAQHLMAAKALPERCQPLDSRAEVTGPTGQAHRIDGAGGGADDHRKRIRRPWRQQFGNRRQHPHLISRSRPTAGKNQACDRFNWAHCVTPCGEKLGLSTSYHCRSELAREDRQ